MISSIAGVFTSKPSVALSPGFTLIPGYFVGWQNNFTGTPNPTIFIKNAAVT